VTLDDIEMRNYDTDKEEEESDLSELSDFSEEEDDEGEACAVSVMFYFHSFIILFFLYIYMSTYQ